MPPATTTTSRSPSGHRPRPSRPNGPRTPTRSPISARHRAWVTGPTSRTVCRSGPSPAGALLTEMAASPTPKAVSMLNCPGRNALGSPETGARKSVVTSPVSARRSTTRWRTGVIVAGPGAGEIGGWLLTWSSDACTSAATVAPVQVEQPDPGGLQAVEEDGGNPHDQRSRGRGRRRPWPAGRPPSTAMAPTGLDGPGVELPTVGREEPAPARPLRPGRRSR